MASRRRAAVGRGARRAPGRPALVCWRYGRFARCAYGTATGQGRSMTASVDIRDISDTARWAAAYRARETLRADALFRDPFAARLAGSRGEQMARKLPA